MNIDVATGIARILKQEGVEWVSTFPVCRVNNALGREGVATFHFRFFSDGTVAFEKLCDGNVWRELSGQVMFSRRGTGAEVTIAMTGHTKTLVPELAIHGPMRKQIDQMAEALRECIENADDRGE